MNNLARRYFMGGKKEADPTESFIITVNVGAGDTFTLPLVSSGNYDFLIDWGDGISDTITTYNQAEVTHTYTDAGTYDINMNGVIEGWVFANGGDKLKIIDVKQFGGENGVKFIGNSCFYGCTNLDITATDIPDLTLTTDLTSFFRDCTSLVYNSSINNWNLSNITSIGNMFRNATSFNQTLNSWDVSNCTIFTSIFRDASSFNQNIGSWDMTSAVDLQSAFEGASNFNNGGSPDINNWDMSNCNNIISCFQNSNFNQPIDGWNISLITSLFRTFRGTPFNQSLNSWDVSNLTTIVQAFFSSSFNGNISNWDVSNIQYMENAFQNSDFNGNISSWTTTSLQNLRSTFQNTPFNQNIGSWDVSNVTNIRECFAETVFNQDISGWDVSNVSNMFRTFRNNSSFNQNIGIWNTSSLVNTFDCFLNCSSLDQDFSNWNVTNLDVADGMFSGVTLSTANYDALLIGWEAQSVQNNVNFSGGNSQYTAGSAAETARQNLINNKGWTITDGGAI